MGSGAVMPPTMSDRLLVLLEMRRRMLEHHLRISVVRGGAIRGRGR